VHLFHFVDVFKRVLLKMYYQKMTIMFYRVHKV